MCKGKTEETEEADPYQSVGAVGLESGICSAGRATYGRKRLSVALMSTTLVCERQTLGQWEEKARAVPSAQSCRWKEEKSDLSEV